MLGKFSSMFQSGTKTKTVYKKGEKIDLNVFENLNDEFSVVTQYLTESLPLKISLPFQGTCLRILNGDRFFVFVSREGKLAIIDSRERVILKDDKVAEQSIWTVGLSKDEKFIYIGGQDPVIKKFSIDSLKLEKEFEGHTGEINSIIVNLSDTWMVSASDDGDVRLWGLGDSNIESKVLFSHKRIVYAMDLSDDNNYIISGSQDRTAIVYELGWEGKTESGRQLVTLQAESAIWAVKISPSNKFTVVGDQNGTIQLFTFNEWSEYKRFKEDDRIRSLDIAKDETFLVSAGADNKVVIWHLDKPRKPNKMTEHTEMIKSAIITHDQQFIVSFGDDCQMIRWKIPFFEEKSVAKTKYHVLELIGIADQFVGITERQLIRWDMKCKEIQSIDLPVFLTKHRVISLDSTLFLISSDKENNGKFFYTVREYNLLDFSLIKESNIATGELKSAAISDDKRYLCIGELYKITTFIIPENLKQYNSQLYHNSFVEVMTISPNNLFVFSAGPVDSTSSSCSVKMIDVIKMNDNSQKNVVCEIDEFGPETISKMTCTRDSSILLIVSDKSIMIWSILSQSKLKSVKLDNPVTNLVKSKVFPYFYLQSDDAIEVWNFENFSLITRLGYKKLDTFTLLNNEEDLAISHEGALECFEAPMFTKHVKIIGEGVIARQNEFLMYVRDIIAGKDVKYIDDFKFWLIMPFMFNIQHIYAYYSYDDCLKYAYYAGQAIPDSIPNEQGIRPTFKADAPYLKSARGHSALSITLSQEFSECAKVILKSLRRRWFTDPFSLIHISDCLVSLNNFGLDGLHKVYEFGLRKSFIQNLPSFCKDVSLPVVVLTNSIETDKTSLLGPNPNVADGSALIFEQTYFKLNMTLGSSLGIDFLESLINCKNERIFETQLVRLILEEKWKKARFVMYGQALLYVGFVVTLAYYSTLELGGNTFVIIPTGINGALLLYEIYQMFAGGIDYFKDVWNYVDLVRSSLFFLYVILLWTNYFENQPDFLALVILVTWVRGVTYFRIFGPTRYLINLLFEVFKDIPAFLVIFFYTILAFSFIFHSLGGSGISTFYITFVSTYSTTLGNSNTDGYDQLHWLFYLLITLFNFIIMLNLLISILSDTYSRVKDNQLIADGQELASMVMEVEMMLFWRSGMNEKQYIHICRDESKDDLTSTKIVSSKFKYMHNQFDKYEKSIEESSLKFEQMKLETQARNEEISKMMKAIRDKLSV